MVRRIIVSHISLLLMSCANITVNSQPFTTQNLVPNNSFEEFSNPPQGWFFNGRDFSRTVHRWSSPTAASPDAYGPGVKVPDSWAEKGFGKEKPRSGKSMAGITVYGCDSGKSHCREYLQVKLAEPLVYGQVYEVSFWLRKLPLAGAVDNIGVAFSDDLVYQPITENLSLTPAWTCRKTAGAWVDKWQRIGDTIRATGEERFLIIGNFQPDSLTTFKPARKNPLPYAYYYIDDVMLVKQPPFLPARVIPEDLATIHPEQGMLVRLKNIYFDSGKATLLPSAISELQKLYLLMLSYPNMVIDILGHTDSQGGETYNQDLSERRAGAVVTYLSEQGIVQDRMVATGRGLKQPVATNETPEGRQKNRRVEFLVLKM